MSDNIHFFTGQTSLDIPVGRVIKGMLDDKDDFSQVLVVGFDKDGSLFSRSSTTNVGVLLELIETFKHNLLSGDYGRAE